MIIGNTLSDIRPYKFVLGLNETKGTNSTISILESPSGLVAVVLALQDLQLDFNFETQNLFEVVVGFKSDPYRLEGGLRSYVLSNNFQRTGVS